VISDKITIENLKREKMVIERIFTKSCQKVSLGMENLLW